MANSRRLDSEIRNHRERPAADRDPRIRRFHVRSTKHEIDGNSPDPLKNNRKLGHRLTVAQSPATRTGCKSHQTNVGQASAKEQAPTPQTFKKQNSAARGGFTADARPAPSDTNEQTPGERDARNPYAADVQKAELRHPRRDHTGYNPHMAIICPPGSKLPESEEGPGWYTAETRWGTELRKNTPHHLTGLKAWSKPCSFLNGSTLYDCNRAYLAAQARLWKTTPNAQTNKAAYISLASSTPFTNMRGVKTTRRPFELWMHVAKPNTYARGSVETNTHPSVPGLWGDLFHNTIQESDMPPPNIVDPIWHQDGTYSATVPNYAGFSSTANKAHVYVSLPSDLTLFPPHVFQVDIAFIDIDTGALIPSPGNVPGCALKPFPIGTPILFGLRADPTTNAYVPSPLAATLIEVQP